MNQLCPACKEKNFKQIYYINSTYLDQKEMYVIYQCTICGHGFADGNSSDKYLNKIYNHSFFSSDQQKDDKKNTPINRNANNRAKELAKKKQGSLLDIGSGTGAFLEASQVFFDVSGVEFSKSAAKIARNKGFSVYQGDFLAVDMGNKKYDLITLWDVISCMKSPQETLEKCHSILFDSGAIVMTVPMIDSRIAKLFKSKWPLLIPPVNLHYFTKKSIIALLENTGFNLLSIKYNSKRVSLKFIAIKAARSFGFKFLEPIFDMILPEYDIPLNLGDIATITFKKNKNK